MLQISLMIIGITGTNGAGKGTIVEYLIKNKKFRHFSVGNFLKKEIIKRGLKVDRETMRIVGNDLRQKFGSSYLAETLYNKASKIRKNCVIESLRTVGEINCLRNKPSFYLFAVDADPKLRYERIRERGSEKDNISFQAFIEGEEKELQSDDPKKQNLKKCISLADYKFTNNNSVPELFGQVEDVLKKIID